MKTTSIIEPIKAGRTKDNLTQNTEPRTDDIVFRAEVSLKDDDYNSYLHR